MVQTKEGDLRMFHKEFSRVRERQINQSHTSQSPSYVNVCFAMKAGNPEMPWIQRVTILKHFPASCARDATLLGSFDIDQKIVAGWTLDEPSFIVFWLARA